MRLPSVLSRVSNLNGKIFEPVGPASSSGKRARELEGDFTRFDDVMNHDVARLFKENDAKQQDANTRSITLSGAVTIENICFGYNRLEKPLINDFL